MAADFVSGKAVRGRFYFNNQPWELKFKSMDIEEIGVEVTDQINGEQRARFQKITDGYKVTVQAPDDGQATQMFGVWLANQQNEDNNAPQLPFASGLRISYLDGTAGAWALQGCNLGPLKYSIGGRTERNMGTITFRAQYFVATPAA